MFAPGFEASLVMALLVHLKKTQRVQTAGQWFESTVLRPTSLRRINSHPANTEIFT